ncbi:hypothetical protein Dimus_032635 [Dionaea muscipula]
MTHSSGFRSSAAKSDETSSTWILLGDDECNASATSAATSAHELDHSEGLLTDEFGFLVIDNDGYSIEVDHEHITPSKAKGELPSSQPNTPNSPPIDSYLQQGTQKKVNEPCPSLIQQQPQGHTFDQKVGMNCSTLQQGGQEVNGHCVPLMGQYKTFGQFIGEAGRFHQRRELIGMEVPDCNSFINSGMKKPSNLPSGNRMVDELSQIPPRKKQLSGALDLRVRMKVVSANRKSSIAHTIGKNSSLLLGNQKVESPGFAAVIQQGTLTGQTSTTGPLAGMKALGSDCKANIVKTTGENSSSQKPGYNISSYMLQQPAYTSVGFGGTSSNVSSLKVEELRSCQPSHLALQKMQRLALLEMLQQQQWRWQQLQQPQQQTLQPSITTTKLTGEEYWANWHRVEEQNNWAKLGREVEPTASSTSSTLGKLGGYSRLGFGRASCNVRNNSAKSCDQDDHQYWADLTREIEPASSSTDA